jgi:hypothetical protein
MAESPRDPPTGDDPGVGPDRGQTEGMPRWVKVSAIVMGALILLVVVVLLAGGGEHGPRRHGALDTDARATVPGLAAHHAQPGIGVRR